MDRRTVSQSVSQTERQRDRQTDSQLDRQIDRQSDRQTDRQTDRQSVSQSDRQTDRQTDSQLDRQTVRQTERQTDRQTDSQLDRQTDGRATDRRQGGWGEEGWGDVICMSLRSAINYFNCIYSIAVNYIALLVSDIFNSSEATMMRLELIVFGAFCHKDRSPESFPITNPDVSTFTSYRDCPSWLFLGKMCHFLEYPFDTLFLALAFETMNH